MGCYERACRLIRLMERRYGSNGTRQKTPGTPRTKGMKDRCVYEECEVEDFHEGSCRGLGSLWDQEVICRILCGGRGS